MALRLHDKPLTFHLTELALSAAVVAWWSRWQPIAMHRAFLAGVSLAEVATAVTHPRPKHTNDGLNGQIANWKLRLAESS
ncbi:MAG: hypothetical protein QOE51_1064 [Actinoplanes sp.]|jgi:hypothetical protein|nr:hypothetical protein [Actinoplanes sp.]